LLVRISQRPLSQLKMLFMLLTRVEPKKIHTMRFIHHYIDFDIHNNIYFLYNIIYIIYISYICSVHDYSLSTLQESQMDVLQEAWISQANARQRRGRAGRVRSGECYHLVCKFTVDNLPDFSMPEMLRMSLSDLTLQVTLPFLHHFAYLIPKRSSHLFSIRY
jgi:hypothetical protein